MSFEYKAETFLEAIAILAIAIVAGEKVGHTSIVNAVHTLHLEDEDPTYVCDRLQHLASALQHSKRDKSIPI